MLKEVQLDGSSKYLISKQSLIQHLDEYGFEMAVFMLGFFAGCYLGRVNCTTGCSGI